MAAAAVSKGGEPVPMSGPYSEAALTSDDLGASSAPTLQAGGPVVYLREPAPEACTPCWHKGEEPAGARSAFQPVVNADGTATLKPPKRSSIPVVTTAIGVFLGIVALAIGLAVGLTIGQAKSADGAPAVSSAPFRPKDVVTTDFAFGIKFPGASSVTPAQVAEVVTEKTALANFKNDFAKYAAVSVPNVILKSITSQTQGLGFAQVYKPTDAVNQPSYIAGVISPAAVSRVLAVEEADEAARRAQSQIVDLVVQVTFEVSGFSLSAQNVYADKLRDIWAMSDGFNAALTKNLKGATYELQPIGFPSGVAPTLTATVSSTATRTSTATSTMTASATATSSKSSTASPSVSATASATASINYDLGLRLGSDPSNPDRRQYTLLVSIVAIDDAAGAANDKTTQVEVREYAVHTDAEPNPDNHPHNPAETLPYIAKVQNINISFTKDACAENKCLTIPPDNRKLGQLTLSQDRCYVSLAGLAVEAGTPAGVRTSFPTSGYPMAFAIWGSELTYMHPVTGVRLNNIKYQKTLKTSGNTAHHETLDTVYAKNAAEIPRTVGHGRARFKDVNQGNLVNGDPLAETLFYATSQKGARKSLYGVRYAPVDVAGQLEKSRGLDDKQTLGTTGLCFATDQTSPPAFFQHLLAITPQTYDAIRYWPGGEKNANGATPGIELVADATSSSDRLHPLYGASGDFPEELGNCAAYFKTPVVGSDYNYVFWPEYNAKAAVKRGMFANGGWITQETIWKDEEETKLDRELLGVSYSAENYALYAVSRTQLWISQNPLDLAYLVRWKAVLNLVKEWETAGGKQGLKKEFRGVVTRPLLCKLQGSATSTASSTTTASASPTQFSMTSTKSVQSTPSSTASPSAMPSIVPTAYTYGYVMVSRIESIEGSTLGRVWLDEYAWPPMTTDPNDKTSIPESTPEDRREAKYLENFQDIPGAECLRYSYWDESKTPGLVWPTLPADCRFDKLEGVNVDTVVSALNRTWFKSNLGYDDGNDYGKRIQTMHFPHRQYDRKFLTPKSDGLYGGRVLTLPVDDEFVGQLTQSQDRCAVSIAGLDVPYTDVGKEKLWVQPDTLLDSDNQPQYTNKFPTGSADPSMDNWSPNVAAYRGNNNGKFRDYYAAKDGSNTWNGGYPMSVARIGGRGWIDYSAYNEPEYTQWTGYPHSMSRYHWLPTTRANTNDNAGTNTLVSHNPAEVPRAAAFTTMSNVVSGVLNSVHKDRVYVFGASMPRGNVSINGEPEVGGSAIGREWNAVNEDWKVINPDLDPTDDAAETQGICYMGSSASVDLRLLEVRKKKDAAIYSWPEATSSADVDKSYTPSLSYGYNKETYLARPISRFSVNLQQINDNGGVSYAPGKDGSHLYNCAARTTTYRGVVFEYPSFVFWAERGAGVFSVARSFFGEAGYFQDPVPIWPYDDTPVVHDVKNGDFSVDKKTVAVTVTSYDYRNPSRRTINDDQDVIGVALYSEPVTGILFAATRRAIYGTMSPLNGQRNMNQIHGGDPNRPVIWFRVAEVGKLTKKNTWVVQHEQSYMLYSQGTTHRGIAISPRKCVGSESDLPNVRRGLRGAKDAAAEEEEQQQM